MNAQAKLRTSLRINSRRNHEQGIIILLVAVVLLFVVGAMAALSIDVVTFYTARSEAQLAADGAALAAARVLANSGMTSNPSDSALVENAENLASTIAIQIAQSNRVGARALNRGAGDVINVTFPAVVNGGNPQVTVQVRSDMPTFFARIFGRMTISVGASATAEAYNPSGLNTVPGVAPPVAPICVKPWLLPNIDPSAGTTIFNAATGAITNPALLGWTSGTPMQTACSNCTSLPNPTAWNYYPGTTDPGNPPTTFPPPTQVPNCTPAMTTFYEQSIAGCVQTAIACNSLANIDTSNYVGRRTQTANAVNCLTHSQGDLGDQVDFAAAPSPPPFQFLAGNDNPVPGLAGNDVMVSDSLVTVPVFDVGSGPPTNPVQIVGFVQLFLNADGHAAPSSGANRGQVNTTVINMAGCGTGSIGLPIQPILGNGAGPVPVRLISPP